MKKITLLIALMITSLGFAQSFPFTFESGTTTFTDYDGGVSTQIPNPDPTGINTSATVVRLVKAAQPYSGTKIIFPSPVDFSVNKVVKMKVWSPVAGKKLTLKFEGPSSFEINSAAIPAAVWTELTFDYSGISNSLNSQMVFMFDLAVNGDGGPNSTYYFDDITFSPPTVVYDPIVLPLDFENTNQNFVFGDFNGGVMTKVANPDPAGNSSATCLKMVKGPVGAIYGGSSFFLSSPLDLSLGKYFRMNVWSPKSGGTVALKFEGTGAIFDMISGPLVPGWQTVTFDGTALTTGASYNKLVLFNELNVSSGDGTANSTYYYDDIRQSLTLSTAKFETSSVKMYPNPVKNTLTIDANSTIQRVSVYNILGQEVMMVSPKSNSATLQTGSLQKGAYMVQTEIDGNVSTSKIIKE
jgi:hypothetical protein